MASSCGKEGPQSIGDTLSCIMAEGSPFLVFVDCSAKLSSLISMKNTLLLVCALSVFCGRPVHAQSQSEERPNVLFIVIDDLNDWIGCLKGHPDALTPNIDRLAERGVLFTNAHCAAPACNPSRAAVFSGLLATRTGVWSNGSGSIEKKSPDSVLLPTSFSKAGYLTFGTGKLLHSSKQGPFDKYFATQQRWSPLPESELADYTEEELPSKGTDNPRHVVEHNGKSYVLPLNRLPSDRSPDSRKGESHDWGPWDVPDSDFGDTLITDWALERLGTAKKKPFFLAVGYYRPHIPLWAPARFFDRFEDQPAKLPVVLDEDLDDLSETARQWALEPRTAGSHATTIRNGQWGRAVEAYLACTTYVDHEIGRLLDALDQSRFADNTAIVLWSDHGWHLGEKQHWGKWTGWERSTRVPMIIVPPKNRRADFAPGGSRCAQPVGLIDLYSTLADLCGVEAPTDLDGESLVPLLRDPAQQTGRVVATLFSEGNLSLRDERFRYLRYEDGSEELYDLETDPAEWYNLAADPHHAERLDAFAAQVEAFQP